MHSTGYHRNIDVMILPETKLDELYSSSQLYIDRFPKPFRLDRNHNVGRILIYVREDIQLSNYSLPDTIEGIFCELNFRKSRWLVFGTYHPPSQRVDFHFENVGRALDIHNKFDKILIAVDLNAKESLLKHS